MNLLFAPYMEKFVIVFFDDKLIYRTLIDEHTIHLTKVLDYLYQNQLYPKLSKCLIGRDKIEYLGHFVSKERVIVNPSKIETIIS